MGDTQELIERARAADREWYSPGDHPILSVAADRWIKEARPLLPEMADTIASLQRGEEKLREAIKGPLSWLERWAEHKGNCMATSEVCTCGLALARHELRQALEDTDSAPADARNGGEA